MTDLTLLICELCKISYAPCKDSFTFSNIPGRCDRCRRKTLLRCGTCNEEYYDDWDVDEYLCLSCYYCSVDHPKIIAEKSKHIPPERTSDLVRKSEDEESEKISEEERKTSTSLADIPSELVVQVLINLNDEDLANASRTDKRAAEVSATDLFWYERIKHVFDYDLLAYKENALSYRDMYRFFMEHKTLEYQKIIHDAIRLKYLPILKYIIEKIRPDFNINRALVITILPGDLNMFRYLVHKGADPLFEFSDKYTPFRYAVDRDRLDIVQYIVEIFKPNIDTLSKALGTASTYSRRNSPIIELLQNAGATDIYVKPDYDYWSD